MNALRCALLTSLSLTTAALTAAATDWSRFSADKVEEPAGGGGMLEINPVDTIYGFYYVDSTRLKHAPVAGNFEVGLLYNGIEEAIYGSVGMTLRIIPRTRLAPFIGGGANYNPSIARYGNWVVTEEGQRVEQGDSYWAGFAEAGVRIRGPYQTYYEFGGRYIWTDSDLDDAEYWSLRIGYGVGF